MEDLKGCFEEAAKKDLKTAVKDFEEAAWNDEESKDVRRNALWVLLTYEKLYGIAEGDLLSNSETYFFFAAYKLTGNLRESIEAAIDGKLMELFESYADSHAEETVVEKPILGPNTARVVKKGEQGQSTSRTPGK